MEQREHKYRAWHKKEKKMYPVSAIYFKAEISASGIGPADVLQDVSEVEIYTSKGPIFLNRDDIILMEYIGEKDNQGIEIYEGDIAKHKNDIFQVRFHKGAFVMDFDGKDFDRKDKNVYLFNLMIEGKIKIEIIGNMYENPELLNKLNPGSI